MSKWLWGTLVLALLLGHAAEVRPGNFDDMSVLRAGAYLHACEDGRLLDALTRHLDERASLLSPRQVQRYRFRFEFADQYLAVNWLVPWFDALGWRSAYAAPILAVVVLHLFAASVLFLALGGFAARDAASLRVGLVASLVGLALPAAFADLLPFQSEIYLWSTTAPRGAAATFVVAGLVLWSSPSVLSVRSRAAGCAAAALAAYLCHRSMAMLCILPALALVLALRITRGNSLRWSRSLGAGRFAVVFAAVVLATAGAKALLLSSLGVEELRMLRADGVDPSPTWGAVRWAAWAAASLALAWAGLRRPTPAGDTLLPYYLPFAAIVLGLNAVHPREAVWENPIFLVSEASLRLGAIPHLLSWMLAVSVLGPLSARLGAGARRAWVVGLAGLVCVAGVLRTLEQARHGTLAEVVSAERRAVRIGDVLARPGRAAYRDEVAYFQGIANHVVAVGCAAPPPRAVQPKRARSSRGRVR